MSFECFGDLCEAFERVGVSEILVKVLAENQDNEKNQIYLGYSHEFLSLIPGVTNFRSPSSSRAKRASSVGGLKTETVVDFWWLDDVEEPALAPKAKIIDYFQYPEMRFSGFLSGCSNPPDSLRREHQDDYGRRVLVLGITDTEMFGAVVTDESPQLVNQLMALPLWPVHSLFRILGIGPKRSLLVDPAKLLSELRALSGSQYESQILRRIGEATESFRGTQGAGWTLEALLGIPRNSSGDPDKYGIELKAFLGTTITLMTPEPNFGYRHDKGLTAFLKKYGWVGTKSDGSRRFNGKHDTQRVYKKSGLILEIENWNMETNSPTGRGSPNVALVDAKTDEIAAGWTFDKLAEKWGRKHAGAMFVKANKFLNEGGSIPSHYSYGPEVHCGRGTSPILLIKAIADGLVYLDPGDRVDATGHEKKRTQWRVNKKRGVTLGASLSPLYDEMKTYLI